MSTRRPTPRGDEAALYARHDRALHRAVANRVATRSPQTVEDACQLAWLRLLAHQPDRATVWPWLLTVAEREAWRLERAATERCPLTSVPVDTNRLPAPEPTSAPEEHTERELVAALRALPARQRRAMLLLVAGHSYVEIADATGETMRSVARQLRLARHHLRVRLREPSGPWAADDGGDGAPRCSAR